MTSRTHLLFDLDQTLMASNSAGGAALGRAFDRVPGAEGAFAGLNYQGRTDLWIVREVARASGVPEATLMTAYREQYPPLLLEELAQRDARVLPGVVALLEALRGRDDVVMGLGTGNWRDTAFMKLEHVGLAQYFETGGFGDRHDNRPDMLREGAEALGWSAGERLVVIGDSEHDITGAAAIGAIGIGVATGSWTEDQLNAAGADATLPSFAELAVGLRVLLG
ncbi:MAG: HAD hydrolase-like protein [Chloroflexi bacterium]|nr:HAD hydrolase-like protein [Chloroflexota bacterium]MDA1144999.1 HAD hydrolase-like protein [Chloroflexota bacterium]